MGVVFIEGLPGAGKSTLVRALNADNLPICHELGHTIPLDSFPGNGSCLDEVLAIDDWFIEQETKRHSMFSTGFFDRSYFTHLAYSFAYGKHANISSLFHTVNKYAAAIDCGLLPTPDALIYLVITPEESIRRQHARVSRSEEHPLPAFWQDSIFLQNTCVAYSILQKSMSGITIVEVDGNDPVQKQVDSVAHLLRQKTAEKNIDLVKYVQALA